MGFLGALTYSQILINSIDRVFTCPYISSMVLSIFHVQPPFSMVTLLQNQHRDMEHAQNLDHLIPCKIKPWAFPHVFSTFPTALPPRLHGSPGRALLHALHVSCVTCASAAFVAADRSRLAITALDSARTRVDKPWSLVNGG